MDQCIIVIPCYNEAARFRREAFVDFVRNRPDVRFLLVDDGSTDGTREVLDALARSDPQHFEVFNLPRNMGKAEAVRRGILRALSRQPQMVGFWDADLATPLEAIPQLCTVLSRHPRLQIVLGARVQLLGRSIRRKALRHYLGRVFATAASLVLRMPVYDTQCGAKVFRAGEATAELFARPFCSRWIFDVELLARLVQLRRDDRSAAPDQAVYEFPLDRWTDVPGSKLRLRDFLKALVELIRIWWIYRRPAAAAPSVFPLPTDRHADSGPSADRADRAA